MLIMRAMRALIMFIKKFAKGVITWHDGTTAQQCATLPQFEVTPCKSVDHKMHIR